MSEKRDNPKYPPWHCFTLTLCQKCGEGFEAAYPHICKKKNSWPIGEEKEEGKKNAKNMSRIIPPPLPLNEMVDILNKENETLENGAGNTLRPCPFCGGTAELYTSDIRKGLYCIECNFCGISTPFQHRDEVIDLWNTRINEETDE